MLNLTVLVVCPAHRSLVRIQWPAAIVPSRASLIKAIYDEEADRAHRQSIGKAERLHPLAYDFDHDLPVSTRIPLHHFPLPLIRPRKPLECDFVHAGCSDGVNRLTVPPYKSGGTRSAEPPIAFSARVHLFFVVVQLFLKAGEFSTWNYYGYNADLKERVQLAIYLYSLWTYPAIFSGPPLKRPACLASTPISQL